MVRGALVGVAASVGVSLGAWALMGAVASAEAGVAASVGEADGVLGASTLSTTLGVIHIMEIITAAGAADMAIIIT